MIDKISLRSYSEALNIVEAWQDGLLLINQVICEVAGILADHPNGRPYELPFKGREYLPENKPPHMKGNVYKRIILGLQVLENMPYTPHMRHWVHKNRCLRLKTASYH